MSTIDFSTDFGKHALARLEEEQIVWLTVVTPSGQPAPNPVWFIWKDERVLILSQPNQAKLRAIAANPKIALAFNTTPDGNDVVVFTGTAELGDTISPEDAAAYVIKYRDGMQALGSTPEQFAAAYSTAITITLTGLRGFAD